MEIDISNASFVRAEGGFVKGVATGAYGSTLLCNKGSTSSFSFRASGGGSLSLRAYTAGEPIEILVDGAETGSVSTAGGGDGISTLKASIDSAEKEYRLIFWGSGPFESEFISALVLDGGATLNTGWAPPSLRRIAFIGDSITRGTYSTGGDARLGVVYPVAVQMPAGVFNNGWDGQTIHGYLTFADFLSGSAAYTDIVIWLVTNDANAGTAQGAYESDYSDVLTALRAGWPLAKIWCLGGLQRNDATNAAMPAYNGYVQNVVAAKADANIVYHSTTDWIDPSTDLPDDLHPSPTAYATKIVPRMLALLAPTSSGGSRSRPFNIGLSIGL